MREKTGQDRLDDIKAYKEVQEQKELIHQYASEWFEKDRETLIRTYGLKVPW